MHRTLALIACLALAGCSGSSDATADEADGGTPLAGSVVEAPQWALGDWWSVQDEAGRVYSIVVAGESGGDWTMLSNDREIALLDYRVDFSYLGNTRKSDLAGSQGSDRPAYFDWPLENGKTWTTKWDGAQRTLTATLAADGRFEIAGTDDGELAVEYIYNPAKKWLDELTFYNVTGGEVQYRWTATGSGEGFSGTLFRYLEVREAYRVDQEGIGSPTGTIPVSEGVSELVVSWDAQCQGPGYLAGAVQPPNEDGSARPLPPTPPPASTAPDVYGFADQCPQVDGPGTELVSEPLAGDWRVDGIVASNQGGFWLTVDVRTFERISM